MSFPSFSENLREFLELKVETYNSPRFIELDPVSVPHLFTRKQDIEIMGLWAAILAWGQRKTIISKSRELVNMMGGEPYRFISEHSEQDLKPFLKFKHRTFNDLDALYFISFFRHFYSSNETLEEAFLFEGIENETNTEKAISTFHQRFFSLNHSPARTRKHVSTPDKNSACKRICMFLRWMVRNDGKGVDFGIWNRIRPDQLVCPCDVHVDRIARGLRLIQRPKTDWQTALELTENLKKFDPKDPVKYDFALFGIGIEEKTLSFI